MNVRVDAAGRQYLTLARDDLRAGADHDRDAGLRIRVAGLAECCDAAVLDADVGFHDAPVVDDQRVRDHEIHRVGGSALTLTHAVTNDLATAELHFVAVHRVVGLDLDHELGVAEPHAVAGGRAEHVGVGAPRDLHGSGPMTRPRNPYTRRSPASATSSTVRSCPGSKRTAVPAGMFSRNPSAAARSKRSASFVSAKW